MSLVFGFWYRWHGIIWYKIFFSWKGNEVWISGCHISVTFFIILSTLFQSPPTGEIILALNAIYPLGWVWEWFLYAKFQLKVFVGNLKISSPNAW